VTALPAAAFLTGGDRGGAKAGRAVFVSDFVHMAVPFEELAPVLVDPDMAWLLRLEDPTAIDEELASGADSPEIGDSGGAPLPHSEPTTGESDVVDGAPPSPRAGTVSVLTRVGPTRRPAPVVRVIAGPARRHDGGVIVPIYWEPGRHERLFPKLDADLELSHLDGPYSRLAISGRYRVPLAQIGLSLDRVALHHVAESSLRRFLREAEAAIVAER